MNPDHNHEEEKRLADLFDSAMNHLPRADRLQPDAEFIERLREESAAVFASQSSQQTSISLRRKKMFILAMRALVASAAAVAAVSGIFWISSSSAEDGLPLGTVLEKMAAAETVTYSIARADGVGRGWSAKPNHARWDQGEGRYEIAEGNRIWQIDEKANRATPKDSSYFRAVKAGPDLFFALRLPKPAVEGMKKRLAEARPVSRLQRDGGEYHVYRLELPAPQGNIRIEALVNVKTHLLRSLVAESGPEGSRPQKIGELTVLAVNAPLDEDLFVVGDTLTRDGRIGKVTDVQGIVSLKPVMHRRWTPVAGSLILKPGDYVRTDARGANAVSLRLVPGTNVTLGPGSLVELVMPDQIRLITGELRVATEPKVPVELLGPGGEKINIKGTQIYRVQKEKLARLEKPPMWLRGFEGSANNESIGSLVAKVEGRNVPLTVGYHKVRVDIRDQIARTVIEESFVNHTKGQLEGVFYFPLPQDASISGFGMWIDGKLVEADVVEKQRAREIYETILRERRDPGLLEWSGGNIFKARVFPIFAHSEKRIKITYTQVLPLRGNSFRYSYALQSELLKQHPLRELAIDVRIDSAARLAKVTSPTHSARIRRSDHSARVEFNAQEYTPSRDFEVVVELAHRQSDVVMIPHRRGEDGYFMLQVTPAAAGGDRQRDIIADGEPLQLLILADTSASMDAGSRARQAEFIAALLNSLGPDDKINLAVCDVDIRWVFEKPLAADKENVAAARKLLADCLSLGWTDLDKSFAAAFSRSGPKTHVIYVGDGIVTGKDSDPARFANRLRRQYQGQSGTCHAVAVSSSFEPLAMKTIASLRGGSVRHISDAYRPARAAAELLGEITRPTLRDLKVEFSGLRAVRVYPRELPNLAAGSQQILLGRYLPQGRDQQGRVRVSGRRGGKVLRLSTPVSLKDAEKGNSFIPRLWARMHLDALLAEGGTSAITDEIIALGEEYHIMTPYTSLLVLESDADRERFKVKRRFQMRDGQKYFAEGSDNVDYALVQQQMKLAGNWRLGLRRSVLGQLATLGRDTRMFQQERYRGRHPRGAMGMGGGMGGGIGGGWMAGGSFGASSIRAKAKKSASKSASPVDISNLLGSTTSSWAADLDGPVPAPKKPMPSLPMDDREKRAELELGEKLGSMSDLKLLESSDRAFNEELSKDIASTMGFAFDAPPPSDSFSNGTMDRVFSLKRENRRRGYAMDHYFHRQPRNWSEKYTSWLNRLFPGLPERPSTKPLAEPEKPWPANARALAESLLRTEQLARLEGGLRIGRRRESFDVRWDKLTAVSSSLALVSPQAWLNRYGGGASQSIVHWCDAKQRGVLSLAFGLGRFRDSTPEDLCKPPLALAGHVLHSLERTYQTYSPTIERQDEERTLLVLGRPSQPERETRILIDTGRHVVLRIEHRHDGKITSTTIMDKFVEVAGAWWATRIETTDADGRRQSLVTQQFGPLAADEFKRRLNKELAARDDAQLIRQPLVEVLAAKQAIADGKARFDGQLALLLHFCKTQQWDRAVEHLDRAERLAAAKPPLRWIRDAVLKVARRREELKQRIEQEAAELAHPRVAGQFSSEEYFLAEYLRGQAAGVLEANEMLALLDRLRPIYKRQPVHLLAIKRWTLEQANFLARAGQTDKVFKLREQLARRYPRDCNLQQQYARALKDGGDYPAAYRWLQGAIVEDRKWRPHEEEQLRNLHASFLREQGRHGELAEYLGAWVELNPSSGSAYQQYLTALIRSDREDEANRLTLKWLAEGRKPGKPAADVAARLGAAVDHALGQGYNLHSDRIDERWLKPLEETVLFFARHKTRAGVADRIMRHRHFRDKDNCRRIRKKIAAILAAEIDELSANQIGRFVNWIWPNDPAVRREAWGRMADGLKKRWNTESDPDVKNHLGRTLVKILFGRIGSAEHLDFLRLQLREGPKKYRTAYANTLFSALLGRPWSAEGEDEAFSLLERLSDAKEPAQKLTAQVKALYRLTDTLVKSRFDARMKKVEHREKLSRTELRRKKIENLRLARGAYADRLQQRIEKHPAEIGRWIYLERLYIEVRLGQNLPRVADECWELLGPMPSVTDSSKPIDKEGPGQMLQEVFEQRLLTTLSNLAARKGAQPELIDRLLKYIDKSIAADEKDDQPKLAKYRLLIALDRPKQLQRALRSWIKPESADSYWRLSLGYLLAEEGKIDEAVRQFEAVEAADELGATEYRALANWYMVLDRRQQYERAIISAFKVTDEWRLRNWIDQKLRPWQRRDGALPVEMDKNVPLVFRAIFEKSGHPQNHLHLLQRFYQETRDFRLLSCLSDAVIGHTAAKVYPFLQGMGRVLGEIRDEATVDQIVEHLRAKVRPRAKTVIDRRALDLMEMLVERRAAELQNQPGPHAKRALAAMRRAFKAKWSPGEPRLMADFLAALGRISQADLAREQLRQLEFFHNRAVGGTIDRLHIAHCRANALWSYSRHDEAIDLLEAALNEFQDARGGILPRGANGPLGTYAGYLRSQKNYTRAEKVLHEQLAHPINRQQTFWLTERLHEVYEDALRHEGQVSLGAGATLFEKLQGKIQADLETADHNHRHRLINRLCSIYRTAKNKKLPDAAKDLKTFAFKLLPQVLKRQTNSYQSIVNNVAHALRDVAGPRDGLAFLIERMENEPTWFRHDHQRGWNQFGWMLGNWRREVKDLGELEGRLLAIVTAELRRDLKSRRQHNRNMYHNDHGHFWKEKENDFANTAEEVLVERKQSGAAVQYIADYLYHGLDRYDRAIEILLDAHRRKILDEGGQFKLVDFLQGRNRHGESIAILEPLVERSPNHMRYRTRLLHAYFRTSRHEALLALLKKTDAHFHQKDRWTEGAMAQLGKSCLENRLFEQSAAYYEELIPLHQRTQPRRGIGNGTLSRYYTEMARAYAGLKNTARAVDAACGAIVSWGPRHSNRAHALRTLGGVLGQSPNLDQYVAELDKQSAESGLHNPIVRKALGQVYAQRNEQAKAIVQLRLAVELQPNDVQTHEALVGCYDKLHDNQGAIQCILGWLQLAPRRIELYGDLAKRLEAMEKQKQAERARTSIVEMLPNESQSHAMLAGIRQEQDRWPEAIGHWKEVARIRELEPTGLLRLAEAQIRQKQWAAAMETLRKLRVKNWPSRFGNIQNNVRDLESQIERGRKM